MRKNPCRVCEFSYHYKNRCYPSFKESCRNCEKRKLYEECVKQARKYVAGEPIRSLDELLSQTWVMLNGMTRHIEVVKCNQLNTILKWLDTGFICKAIRKDEL